jgi:hypothetical protein
MILFYFDGRFPFFPPQHSACCMCTHCACRTIYRCWWFIKTLSEAVDGEDERVFLKCKCRSENPGHPQDRKLFQKRSRPIHGSQWSEKEIGLVVGERLRQEPYDTDMYYYGRRTVFSPSTRRQNTCLRRTPNATAVECPLRFSTHICARAQRVFVQVSTVRSPFAYMYIISADKRQKELSDTVFTTG